MTQKIYKQMALAFADVEAIGKNQKNKQQGWVFRGIDDLYNSLHPVLAKHGIFIIPKVDEFSTKEFTSKNGAAGIHAVGTFEFSFVAEDGSMITAKTIGEAMDYGDKALPKAQSIAMKYALMQVFCIPVADETDPDLETHQIAPKTAPKIAPDAQKRAAPASNPTQTNAKASPKKNGCISEAQQKRLFAIANANGWESDQVKDLLLEKGFSSSSDIPYGKPYEEIIACLEMGPAGEIKI